MSSAAGEGSTRKIISVLGATGTIGSAVVAALFERSSKEPITVRAISRNIYSAKHKLSQYAESSDEKSDSQGTVIEFMQADMDDVDSLEAAFEGSWAVHMFTKVGSKEVAQGKNVIDAAIKAEVSFIEYTSVANSDLSTGIPHFESKHEVEEYLRSKTDAFADGFCFIRPVFFFDNFINYFTVKNGSFSMILPKDTKLKMICSTDIGRFCAMALYSPSDWNQKALDCATEELTPEEMAATISRVADTKVNYSEASAVTKVAMSFAAADIVTMFEWFKTDGLVSDISACRKVLEPDYVSFEEWIAKHTDHFSKDAVEYKGPSTASLVTGAIVAGAIGIGAALFAKKRRR